MIPKIRRLSEKYVIYLLIFGMISLLLNIYLLNTVRQTNIQQAETQEILLYNSSILMSRCGKRIQDAVRGDISVNTAAQKVYNLIFAYRMKMHLAGNQIPEEKTQFFMDVGGAIRAVLMQKAQQQDPDMQVVEKMGQAADITAHKMSRMSVKLQRRRSEFGLDPPNLDRLYRQTKDDIISSLSDLGAWQHMQFHFQNE